MPHAQRLRWGVLGCAGFALRRTIPALLETPSAELIAVAGRTVEKAESFRRRFNLPRAYGSYEDLLADPAIDAVYIPLPHSLHAEWMLKSIAAGKHCLCEKPFTVNAAEAGQVRDAAEAAGIRVMEGFMWRFHPQHARATELVKSGAIGPVRLIRASFAFHYSDRSNFRMDPALGGGCVLDIGCYPVSAARYYFGEEPVSVYARGDIDPDTGVDVDMAGIMEFPSGRALIDCSYRRPHHTRLEIVGEKGSIVMPQPWRTDETAVVIVNGKEERIPSGNQYAAQFDNFSRAILSGKSPRFGKADALANMKSLDGVRQAISTPTPGALG